ncbi:hypothetical protein DYB32_007749, partial [Aphanomyces invadans]
VVDIVTKRLYQIKVMLYGEVVDMGQGQEESSPQKCAQLASLLIADNTLPRLVLNLADLPFEARKHVAQIYNNFIRRDLSGFVAYIERQPQIMSALVRGYENADIALNCGTMLRERDNLKIMMNLLRDTSANIQFEAFHVFKVFVANPKKPNEVTQILLNNKDKLVAYLEKFQNEKGAPPQMIDRVTLVG